MTLPNFSVSPSGHRITAHVRAFVDAQPANPLDRPGMYRCELFVDLGPHRCGHIDWYAVHDDFGNLVQVTQRPHS